MSGNYTVPFELSALAAQVDLVEINAHTNKALMITGYYIAQTSDMGDAAAESLSLVIKSGQTTSGSGGSAATPVPLDRGGGAAGFTAEVGNTTKASGGTITSITPRGWNIQLPDDAVLPETEQIVITGGMRATLELAKTPADAIDVRGYLKVTEIG